MSIEGKIFHSEQQRVIYNLNDFELLRVGSELTIPMSPCVGQNEPPETRLRICDPGLRPVVKLHRTSEGDVHGPEVILLGTVAEEEMVNDPYKIEPGIKARGFMVYSYFDKELKRYKNYLLPGQINAEGISLYTPYPKRRKM